MRKGGQGRWEDRAEQSCRIMKKHSYLSHTDIYTGCGRHGDNWLFGGPSMTEMVKPIFKNHRLQADPGGPYFLPNNKYIVTQVSTPISRQTREEPKFYLCILTFNRQTASITSGH